MKLETKSHCPNQIQNTDGNFMANFIFKVTENKVRVFEL
jgi:hypothetical protein